MSTKCNNLLTSETFTGYSSTIPWQPLPPFILWQIRHSVFLNCAMQHVLWGDEDRVDFCLDLDEYRIFQDLCPRIQILSVWAKSHPIAMLQYIQALEPSLIAPLVTNPGGTVLKDLQQRVISIFWHPSRGGDTNWKAIWTFLKSVYRE